jgi:hypothetical protein
MSPMSTTALIRSSPLTRFALAPNPGPMSLDGTNSYVIAADGSESVAVVDPGPLMRATCSCWPPPVQWTSF